MSNNTGNEITRNTGDNVTDKTGSGGWRRKLTIAAAAGMAVLLLASCAVIYTSLNIFLSGTGGKARVSVFADEVDLSGMGLGDVSPLHRLRSPSRIDLRGNAVAAEQYEALAERFIGCEILWDVPFQGQYLDCRIESLTVTSMSDADARMLPYFTRLKNVDASGCPLSETLAEAKKRAAGGAEWKAGAFGMLLDDSVTSLDLTGVPVGSAAEVGYALELFPSVTSTVLTGCGLADEELVGLREKYPSAGIRWNFDFYGADVSSDSEEVDISGSPVVDIVGFRSKLRCFERLSELVMCDCGLSNEEMQKLREDYPDIKFVWRVYMGTWSLRTDAKSFCTNIRDPRGYKIRNKDIEVFKYCTDLEHLDIGHSYLTDITPLAGLTKLKTLIIVGRKQCLEDISPLKDMVHMQYLELFQNKISDLSPLGNMHELLDLNLVFNEVSDITPLLGLTSLERCWISHNRVKEADKELLTKTLPMCQFNFTSKDCTTDGWREHERYFEMRDYFGLWPLWSRSSVNCPCPYDVQPENYLTHYNKYYDALKNEE